MLIKKRVIKKRKLLATIIIIIIIIIIARAFSITLYYSLSNLNDNINIDDYIYDNNTKKRI